MNDDRDPEQAHPPLRVQISTQITCVKREIAMRERVYPRLIETGRMTSAVAARELMDMRAVLDTLEELNRKTMLI